MSLDVMLSTSKCEHCGREDEVFSANITHNLGKMAAEAGVYDVVWRPEECGISKAEQLIGPLSKAIALMEADPKRFKSLNSDNGWGLYKNFVPWLKKYLAACQDSPGASITVSR